jgi:hypothetical protein
MLPAVPEAAPALVSTAAASPPITAQELKAEQQQVGKLLSRAETLIRQQGGKSDIVLGGAHDALANADRDLANGDPTAAHAAYQEARTATRSAVHGFLVALASRYREIAQLKTNSGDQQMAQLALAKAKELAGLENEP